MKKRWMPILCFALFLFTSMAWAQIPQELAQLKGPYNVCMTDAEEENSVWARELEDAYLLELGHAFGNRIARVFSTLYPTKVKSVILLAAGGQYDLSDELKRELLRILNPLLPDEVRRPSVQHFMFDNAHIAPQYWVDEWYTRAAWDQRNANYAEDSLPYETWAAGGTAPMLVIEGENDITALPYEIPDGEAHRITIRSITGAAHALLPEQPEQIAEAILAFLAAY